MADYLAGTVTYKFSLDSRDFDRELDKSRDKIKALGKETEDSSKRANKSLGNVAKDSLRELTQGFTRVVTNQKDVSTSSNDMRQQMSGNIGGIVSSLDGFEKKTRRSTDEVSNFRREIRQAASAVRSLQIAFSGFRAASMIGAITVAAGVLVELVGAALAASGALLTLPAGAVVAAGAFAALKVGLVGLDDAFKAIADGDAEKLNEALQNLSPAAQSFVREIKGLSDAFDPVRRAVQDALFANLDAEVRRFTAGALPGLQGGLTNVARSMNGLALEAANTVRQPFFQGFVDRGLNGTAQAVDTLKGAVTPLAEVIDRVVAAGMPFIQQFAQYITSGLQAAAAFLKTETGMADLEARITTGISVIGQIMGLVGALTTSLGLLFSASESSGKTLIQTLTGIIDKFNAWASSAEGQEKLTNLFGFLNKVLEQTFIIVGAVAGVILTVINFIAGLPQPVQDVIASMVALGIVLTPVIMFLATFTNSIIALGPVVKLVGGLLSSTGGLIARFGGVILQVATQVGGFLLRLAAQALLAGARIALGFLIAMGPIGWIIAAVIALVAVIILNFDTIKKVASDAWGAVSKFAVDAWNNIRSTVSNAWNGIISSVSNGVSNVINFVQGLPGRIRSALGNLGGLLWDAGRQMLEGLGNGISSAVEGVKNKLRDFARGALNTIKSFFGIRSPSRVMAQMGGYMMQGLAQGIERNAGEAARAAQSASEAALAGFGGQATINPSLRVGAATALQARPGGVADGSSSTGQASAPVVYKIDMKIDMKGIMTRSRADTRSVAKDLIESVNEELRTKRLPEIGNGAIAA